LRYILIFLRSRQQHLLITQALLKIERNESVEKSEGKSKDFYLAVCNNDFKLALILYEAYLESKNAIKENDMVYLLLLDINEVLNNLETNNLNMVRSKLEDK